MKILFGLLLLSVAAILVSVAAMRWRLHRHLRRSDAAVNDVLEAAQPEHESTK